MGRVRFTPAMGVSVAAVVLAASGGAYAAAAGSSRTVSACVHHHGGGLYVAHKCARHDKRLKWAVTGPQGPAGKTGATGQPGPTGRTGLTGPAGPGRITTIPLIKLPNSGSGPLVDIPAVGKLDVTSCALDNSGFKYTNESSVTQNYVLMDAFTTRNNNGGDPDTGSVPAGSSFTNNDDDLHDLTRLSVSNGTGVVDFVIAQSRASNDDCLYWGEAYSG